MTYFDFDFLNSCSKCGNKMPHKLEVRIPDIKDNMWSGGRVVVHGFAPRNILSLSDLKKILPLSYHYLNFEYVTERGSFPIELSSYNNIPSKIDKFSLGLSLSMGTTDINEREAFFVYLRIYDSVFYRNKYQLVISNFKKLLISKIPYQDRLCNSCYNQEVYKEEKEKIKPKHGKICSKCGKDYNSDNVSFCSDCGSEVKFKYYCHTCKKPTFDKFCTTCGEKILS